MGRKQLYDWEQDKFVLSWLEGVVKKEDYKREFNEFFEWLKEKHPELDTPTKIIEKRLKDLKSDNPVDREFFESLIGSFKTYLEGKNLKEGTIRAYLRSVRSFFSRNRLPLTFKRGELKVEESLEVRMNHRPKWIISNEEIRAVYGISRPEDRALLLTLYHTGLSPIDVSELRIENFTDTVGKSRFYDENGNWIAKGHVYFEKKREKTDIWQKTCLSEETLHDIEIVLRKRGYPKRGYLLKTQKNERLSVRYINDRLKLLVGQALGEEYGKQFQGSDLRDAYNDALVRADLKEELKDILFGHKRPGAKEHYHVSETTVREAYEKVFKYLTINSVRRSREEFEELKQLILDLEAKIAKLEGENKILRDKIYQIEETEKYFGYTLEEMQKDLESQLKREKENRERDQK